MRTILEAVWGQVATSNFATATPTPSYPGALPPKPKPTVTPKPVPILGEYADLGLQLDGRLEFRGEKNQSALCSSVFFFDPVANCRSAFEPLVDFQFAAKSGGIIADIFGLAWAIGAIAALTFVSGAVAALLMREPSVG